MIRQENEGRRLEAFCVPTDDEFPTGAALLNQTVESDGSHTLREMKCLCRAPDKSKHKKQGGTAEYSVPGQRLLTEVP